MYIYINIFVNIIRSIFFIIDIMFLVWYATTISNCRLGTLSAFVVVVAATVVVHRGKQLATKTTKSHSAAMVIALSINSNVAFSFELF